MIWRPLLALLPVFGLAWAQPAAAASTTWLDANCTAAATGPGGNLVFHNTSHGTDSYCYTSQGLAAGKVYAEITPSGASTINTRVFITNLAISVQVGCTFDGRIINVSGTTIGSCTWGGTIRIAIDIPNQLVWFGTSTATTNWNGSTSNNPANGTGGVSFSIATVYLAADLWDEPGTPTMTLKAAPGFTSSVPSGFSSWDPQTANDPAQLLVSCCAPQ